MAIAEVLITDGTTTLTFRSERTTGTETGLLGTGSFVPHTPQRRNRDLWLLHDDWEPPVETVPVVFEGVAAARAALGSLHRMIRRAREYTQLRIGAPVYLQFRPDTGEALYRSPVREMVFDIEQESYRRRWENDRIHGQITLTREPYWDAVTPVSATLSNPSGTGTAIGVDNTSDATRYNYVDIAAAAITGDLDAPATITLSQQYDAPTNGGLPTWYIGHNAHGTPANYRHQYENSDIGGSGHSTVVNGTCSGGDYSRFQWDGSQLYTYTVAGQGWNVQWSPSYPPTVEESGGRTALLLLRCPVMPQANLMLSVELKFQPLYSPQIYAYRSQPFRIPTGSQLVELGPVQIPPMAVRGMEPVGLTVLQLRFHSITPTPPPPDLDVTVDFMLMLPTDSWAILRPLPVISVGTLSQRVNIIDNSDLNLTYTQPQTGTVQNLPTYAREGVPILLRPNTAQRLYFAHVYQEGTWNVSHRCTVSVSYRPRRLLL